MISEDVYIDTSYDFHSIRPQKPHPLRSPVNQRPPIQRAATISAITVNVDDSKSSPRKLTKTPLKLKWAWSVKGEDIDPIHKGVSLFLLYTNMNTINSLHHVKEHSKISHFLQFESHSSKSFKVRAI